MQDSKDDGKGYVSQRQPAGLVRQSELRPAFAHLLHILARAGGGAQRDSRRSMMCHRCLQNTEHCFVSILVSNRSSGLGSLTKMKL